MHDAIWQTLFLPLEQGAVPPPTSAAKALVFGAGRGLWLPAELRSDAVNFVQPFRPDFRALQQAGQSVHPTPLPGKYASVWVRAGRHRARNEMWIDQALARLEPGGWLVVAGDLKQGADSLVKRLKRSFREGERRSKHHGVVFFTAVPDPSERETGPMEIVHQAEGWATSPGVFSAAHVDPASRLLVEHLPADLSGRIADFGAGWGYLSGEIALRFPAVCHVDLYEADYLALEAAKQNMAARAQTTEAGFFWIDLVGEPVKRQYDAIVMNPPFHEGRAADPALGQAFIEVATKALKNGGRLFLVANRGLPYEAILASRFAQSGELARDPHYKVLWGRR
jgi:16S rRNA (guanine1207-N2)-methyltransferase